MVWKMFSRVFFLFLDSRRQQKCFLLKKFLLSFYKLLANFFILQLMMGRGCGTVVEHMSCNPEVVGSHPAEHRAFFLDDALPQQAQLSQFGFKKSFL